MCGITAAIGAEDTVRTLLGGLHNLEYRGYDSAGIAVTTDDGVTVHKREGKVDQLATLLESAEVETADVGIGHTRWSTHGAPSDANAHPHSDCEGQLAVVHNGIIENHDALRDRLRQGGHVFTSETDTETVSHLIEEHLETESVGTAFRKAVSQLSGSFAIAMVHEDSDAVYATRRGSPLVFGVDDDAYYLASDVPAFLEHTDRVVYLQDGDLLTVTTDGYEIESIEGGAVDRPVERVEWSAEEVEKGRFDHYMLKEIHEQPSALAQTIHGRTDPGSGTVSFDALDAETLASVERLQLVACGTSYHAARYGAQLLRDRGIQARAFLASEYAVGSPPPRDGTLLVGVTQSGETADTLEALRHGRKKGLPTLAVTNVVGSTAARECDDAVFIRAGPEIGVAATKTFTSQVATLTMLAERLVPAIDGAASAETEAVLSALSTLPSKLGEVLADDRTSQLAEMAGSFRDSDAYFFVGRGTGHPVALEGALKLKEISYEHAEGFPAGELKHGPLALVTPDTPVFAVATGDYPEKLRGTIEEVQARGAPVVAVTTPAQSGVIDAADEAVVVPDTHEDLVGMLANVGLQLFSYHTAAQLDRPVDKPRNLAKSVTVE